MQTAFSLPETIALLSRTPSTLNAFLRGLPSRWVTANEGFDSWSAFDIVGHLVIGERTDWMPPAKRILEHGEAIPFDPFDRFAQGKECRGKSLEELLDEFAALRAQNLVALETLHLCPADLAKKGTHQRLGTVTLAQLLATWAAHDLTHLHQLSRVMAYQYRDAVGPWTAFLGVMHCTATAPREAQTTPITGASIMRGAGFMAKVTGIGGVFFKSTADHKRLAQWYSQNLGIQLEPWGGAVLRWTDDKSADRGATAWHVADKNTEWFSPSHSSFMINYRIDNMPEMLAQLKRNGVEILKGPESDGHGQFAWVLDPDGNKVELWEPISRDEPSRTK